MRSGIVVAGKYRIIRELGSGGMGSVWQAVHLVTEREFAIKFLHASCAADGNLLARFFQEARVSGKLRHPSIIEIFDVGTAAELGGAPFLVMELLDGGSLDVLVRKLGPLPPRTVLETAGEVARALALAHDKGIVHRDLKPANVFLHRPGTGALVPKVLDFGISKIASSGTPEPAGGLTQTGAILGSPLYMSPEQAASDKSIDGRSDLHALGVVMWECLVGQPPFNGDTYNNLVVQIITGERPRLADALPSLPEPVCRVVDRAMTRKREDRFQRAAEMAEAIEAALVGLPGTSVTARTSAAELFSRVQPSINPVPLVPQTSVRGSTTGGMWVPSSGAQHGELSPAAMTTTPPVPRSVSRTAFDDTRPASSSNVAATMNDGALPAPVVTASSGQTAGLSTASPATRRSRAWPLVVGGVAIVLAGGLAVVLTLNARHAAATAGNSATITAEPPAATSLAAPTQPATTASASSAALAPLPSSGPVPGASVAAVATSATPTAATPPRWTGAATGRTTPAVATTAARPPPRTASSGRKDSVESSGF